MQSSKNWENEKNEENAYENEQTKKERSDMAGVLSAAVSDTAHHGGVQPGDGGGGGNPAV
jgi:hypothetical protein